MPPVRPREAASARWRSPRAPDPRARRASARLQHQSRQRGAPFRVVEERDRRLDRGQPVPPHCSQALTARHARPPFDWAWPRRGERPALAQDRYDPATPSSVAFCTMKSMRSPRGRIAPASDAAAIRGHPARGPRRRSRGSRARSRWRGELAAVPLNSTSSSPARGAAPSPDATPSPGQFDDAAARARGDEDRVRRIAPSIRCCILRCVHGRNCRIC